MRYKSPFFTTLLCKALFETLPFAREFIPQTVSSPKMEMSEFGMFELLPKKQMVRNDPLLIN
jgi:hypothetical protein